MSYAGGEPEQLEFEIIEPMDVDDLDGDKPAGLSSVAFISWEDLRRDYGIEPVDIESVPTDGVNP